MRTIGFLFIVLLTSFSCNSDDGEPVIPQTYNMLFLGDSYTKGQGVCTTCGYPFQLKNLLNPKLNSEDALNLKVIAETGWTTSNLIEAIANQDLTATYDLVTLLIGVNNQFQSRPFSLFEQEFTELVTTATELADGDKNKIIIISIPDYANTAFGQSFGGPTITEELTIYNNYIAAYCATNELNFIDAQNLIFAAMENPELIAPDNLHPSELAYSILVEQLLPLACDILVE